MDYKIKGRKRIAGIVLLGCAYLFIGFTTSSRLLLDFISTVDDNPYFLVILMGTYVFRPFLGLPPTPLNLFIAYVYGPIGFIIIQTGTVISTIPSFLAGRLSSPDGELGERFGTLWTQIGGLRSMVVITLAPIPLDIVGYSAGLARLDHRDFLTGLFLGAIPWSVGQTIIGWSLENYRVSGNSEIAWLIIACSLLSLLLLAPMVYSYTRKD